MVYVFGKADGTQDHVTVTEKVTDANGDTTTNQSSSSKSAPVSMKVTYKLNGVETKPEDMIGKSGKVTIRYDYTNNEKKTIKVNGKSQTAYVPFTMITGTLLPTDKFSNVEVTNGKVSKVGDNIIALGMTMPGLKDTLNLKFDGESLDMDIPEYFEISADVNDFELDMSMSVATTSVLNDVDVDDFSLAKLEDKMNELQSAADQLTDGTVTLQDGTQTLADSIPALTDGVNQLMMVQEHLRMVYTLILMVQQHWQQEQVSLRMVSQLILMEHLSFQQEQHSLRVVFQHIQLV